MSDTTCAEAGRRGGTTTRDRYGPDHYRRLAARSNAPRGNAAQRASLGEEGMHEKAVRGGEALLAKYGVEHFRTLGRKRHGL